MNKKLVIITLIILSILIIFFLAFKKTQRIELPPAVAINTASQPSIGDGPITIVAFEDMKCSNCRRYDMEIYPYIKTHYIETHKVRYVLIPLAFLNNSLPAGNAALCVSEQSSSLFFQYVDYLYQHQPDEALDWATPENLVQFAKNITGINIDALTTCINNRTYFTRLQENLELAQKVMGDRVQTPMLYINGYLVNPMTTQRIDQIMHAQ